MKKHRTRQRHKPVAAVAAPLTAAELADQEYERILSGVIERRGHLNEFQAGIADNITRTMQASKGVTDIALLTQINTNNIKLEAMLPPRSDDPPELLDLSKLTDVELDVLDRLQHKIRNPDAPSWVAPDDPVTDAMSDTQRKASELAIWIDARRERWTFGDASDDERQHLRNALSDLTYPVVCRSLWREIWQSEVEARVTEATIAAEDRLSKAAAEIAPDEPAPDRRRSIDDIRNRNTGSDHFAGHVADILNLYPFPFGGRRDE